MHGRRGNTRRKIVVLGASAGLLIAVLLCVPYAQRVPAGIAFEGVPRPAAEVRFLADRSFSANGGERRTDQEIFDAVFAMIATARRFIVVDMFLYNDFQGPSPETTRLLAAELTERLIAQKREYPALRIVVITDPINTVYGAIEAAHFENLRAHDIEVALTDLASLRDSNPLYSVFWRLFVEPFGSGSGTVLSNPLGAGRISLRSFLSLLNFKANHRKVIIADEGGDIAGLVTSANAHDASSAHSNVALSLRGAAAADLLETENAVLRLAGLRAVTPHRPGASADSGLTAQILTESKIRDHVVNAIAATTRGDRIMLAMFYLSHRQIIAALKTAQRRGVDIRILLDPNRDAFGRVKSGIPNRPVAHELNARGIPVRWCETHGEQCHSKMLLVDYHDGTSLLVLGSANFTRRNLDDFNLESDVALRGSRHAAPFDAARAFFDSAWRNEDGKTFSVDYARYADPSLLKRGLYRAMEASGISTF